MFQVRAGVITDYGADFFGPIALYASFRTNGTVAGWFMKSAPSPATSAAIVLGGCSLWELCQRYDLRGTPLAMTIGRFEPLDLVAYFLGVAAAVGAERLLAMRPGNRQPVTGN